MLIQRTRHNYINRRTQARGSWSSVKLRCTSDCLSSLRRSSIWFISLFSSCLRFSIEKGRSRLCAIARNWLLFSSQRAQRFSIIACFSSLEMKWLVRLLLVFNEGTWERSVFWIFDRFGWQWFLQKLVNSLDVFWWFYRDDVGQMQFVFECGRLFDRGKIAWVIASDIQAQVFEWFLGLFWSGILAIVPRFVLGLAWGSGFNRKWIFS